MELEAVGFVNSFMVFFATECVHYVTCNILYVQWVQLCAMLCNGCGGIYVCSFAVQDKFSYGTIKCIVYCRGSQTFQPATPKITVPETGDFN